MHEIAIRATRGGKGSLRPTDRRYGVIYSNATASVTLSTNRSTDTDALSCPGPGGGGGGGHRAGAAVTAQVAGRGNHRCGVARISAASAAFGPQSSRRPYNEGPYWQAAGLAHFGPVLQIGSALADSQDDRSSRQPSAQITDRSIAFITTEHTRR